MSSNDATERLAQVLTALPQTKSQREETPPGFLIATGHDDDVMLFLVRIGDTAVTANILLEIITMAESSAVIDCLAETGGLIGKRLDIDIAQQLKTTLTNAVTEVQLVRPIDD